MKITQKQVLFFCFALGAALRILAARGELWLDEIWSLKLVLGLDSPWRIFDKVHSDNNHLLNSLFLYVLGPGQQAFFYRCLALLASIASFPLVIKFARELSPDRNSLLGIFACLIYAVSFVMVLYGSEARGYAPSLFFALLSLLALKEYMQARSVKLLMLFWAAVCLGFLSHYSFGFFYLALLLWQLEYLGSSLPKNFSKLLLTQLVPAVALVILYYLDYRHVPEGSGTFYPFIQVWLESFAVPFGAPQFSLYDMNASLICFAAAICIACVLLAEIVRLKRSANALWVFFAAVIFFVPVCTVVLLEPRVFYVRYFFLPSGFALFLIASFLARLWLDNLQGRALCVFFCLLLLGGNYLHLERLIKFGRGGYLQAFNYIHAHSSGTVREITTNQSFRAQLIWEYHSKFHADLHALRIKHENFSAPASASWHILQQEDLKYSAARELTSPAGRNYTLQAAFPFSGLSGAAWYLYKVE